MDPLAPTQRLVCAYETALARADALPAVAWAPWRPEGIGRHLRVPNLRMFVRHFLVLHMRRTVAVLMERHHVRLATGVGDERDTVALSRLAHFESALAARRLSLRRLLFAFAVPAFLVALVVMPVLFPSDGSSDVLRDAFKAAAVDQSLGSVYDIAVADPGGTVLAFVVVGTLTLVLLCVPMASFGLKRAILASTDGGEEPAGFTRQARATGGLYAVEAAVQRELGAVRPRRELPLDLLCVALGLSLAFPLWLMLGVVAQDRLPSGIAGVDFGGALVPWLALAACIIWVPWRFVRVYDLWRERNGERTTTDRVHAWLARLVPPMLPGEGRRPAVEAAPASWTRRLTAGAVDAVAVMLVAVAAFELGGASVASWSFLANVPVAGALYGAAFRGQTPGKALLRITVLGRGGLAASAGRECLKWIFYGAGGIVTLGVLVAFGVWRARDGRMLHDRVFGTAVVAVAATVPAAVPAQARLRIGA